MPSSRPPKGPGKTRLEPFFSSWNETLRMASQRCQGRGGGVCPEECADASSWPMLDLHWGCPHRHTQSWGQGVEGRGTQGPLRGVSFILQSPAPPTASDPRSFFQKPGDLRAGTRLPPAAVASPTLCSGLAGGPCGLLLGDSALSLASAGLILPVAPRGGGIKYVNIFAF